MILNKETIYTKDVANRKMKVVREFNAPVELVWKAWTDSSILDQWWAPRPWKAVTKSMDFREGGRWLYYMQGPDGSRHHCSVNYVSIVPRKYFTADDAFTDEMGNPTNGMPIMHWRNEFSTSDDGTRVVVDISFDTVEDLEKIIEMGFKEGFAMAHQNLDEVLAKENVA